MAKSELFIEKEFRSQETEASSHCWEEKVLQIFASGIFTSDSRLLNSGSWHLNSYSLLFDRLGVAALC